MVAKRLCSAIALVMLWGATSAQAGFVTYPDSSAWSNAISNVTTVTIPDPAPDNFQFLGTGSASVTYDGVTFSTNASIGDGNFFNVGPGFSGNPAVLSSQQATTGLANILITFPYQVHAFALNFGTFNGSDVTFLLSNGNTVTLGSTTGGYEVTNFVGVTDTTSFTSVLVTSPDEVLNLNNVSYAVPEPASLGLIAFGATVVLGLSRRRAGEARKS